MDIGWIKLHRKITEWEWYTEPNVFVVFMHLLLTCNFEKKKWRGKTILPGEKITSQQHIAEEIRLSVMQVRTALNKLKLTGEITVRTTNKYSLIKINNWEGYQQDNTQHNNPITIKEQSNNNQITTTKEVKKEKKENKEKNITTSEQQADSHVNKLMDIFYKFNPSINFGNKTQRKALVWLFDSVGLDKAISSIEYAISVQGDKYAPTITTPLQLKNKFGDLIVYNKKNKSGGICKI